MPTKAPPVSQAWLKEQFDEIDREFVLVLNQLTGLKRQGILILAEVRKLGEASQANVSPELESAILESATLSKRIDEKVPDQNKCK